MKLVVMVEWEAENREQETSGGAAKKTGKRFADKVHRLVKYTHTDTQTHCMSGSGPSEGKQSGRQVINGR